MRWKFFALSALVFAWAATGFSQVSGSDSALSLSAAADIALRNNPSFGETAEKETQARLAVPVARSALFPTLSAQASVMKQKDAANMFGVRNGGDPYDMYQAGLHLNQLLFQIGSISSIKYAEKNSQIAGYNTDIAKRDLLNNLIQAYYMVTLNSRMVQTLSEQKGIVQETVAITEKRLHTGRAQNLDVLQVKTQLALLEGQILTAQNQLAEAKTILASFLGNSLEQKFQVKDSLAAPTMAEADSFIDKKNAKIPEILRDELTLQQIDDQKRTLIGQNIPYLNLVGNYGFASYDESSQLFTQPANSWSVGLLLTIPLFSGMSSVYQNKELTSVQTQLQLDIKNVKDQVNLQQLNNRKALQTAVDSIRTGEEALRLAQNALQEAKKDYSRATIDYLQYLTAQQQHVAAEQSLNTYKYNYIVALGNYYASAGQDMNRLIDLMERRSLDEDQTRD